jgi:serine/threonine protein kinase
MTEPHEIDEPVATPEPTVLAGMTVAGGPPATAIGGAAAIPGYELLEEVGRGGMGVVYKARQLSLNRTVALKMVLGADHADPNNLVRFLSEAEVVAAIRHPNVVQVYEYGQHVGRPFFAMEYLGGGSLTELLRSTGRLAPRDAAVLVEQVARGVQAAHDLGTVHRDLKPGNVLLQIADLRLTIESPEPVAEVSSQSPITHLQSSIPKVTDFGIAKRSTQADLTRTGAVMGTPAYMSPEQAAGRAKFVGPAADIYALGVILYECLTGRVPFEAEDTVRLLLKVVEDEPPPLHAFAPEVPRDLEAVCLKCLRKDPHARYPTAGELADDLRRFLNAEPVTARSTGLFGRVVGVLDRSLKDTEFAAYGSAMFWFAGIMLLTDVVVTLGLSGAINRWAIPVAQVGRVVVFLAVLAWYRGGRMVPATTAERQLWSLGGGYMLAGLTTTVSLRVAGLGWEPHADLSMYQPMAGLTALMFFALGSIMWGWCYAFGLAFVAAGFVMAVDLRFAPLVFGMTWAAVLIVIGARLRRLVRLAVQPGRSPDPTPRTSGTRP